MAARCRPVAGPPYDWSFSFQGSSPRIVHTAREISVPLTLTNAGVRTWVPGRVHLSYHWLWPIPRELASPSRNVPYQDGIRTDLDEVIPPGASVAIVPGGPLSNRRPIPFSRARPSCRYGARNIDNMNSRYSALIFHCFCDDIR